MLTDREALLAAVEATPLDQGAWAALADCLLEAGDGAGYEAIVGRVLTDFARLELYEALRAEGYRPMRVVGARERLLFCLPGSMSVDGRAQCRSWPVYDPDHDVRWWVLYVKNRDYDIPPAPEGGNYKLLSRDGVLQWVRDPKDTAEPRITTTR